MYVITNNQPPRQIATTKLGLVNITWKTINNPFLGADTSVSILIKFIESVSKHFSLFFCDALNDGLNSQVYYMKDYMKVSYGLLCSPLRRWPSP